MTNVALKLTKEQADELNKCLHAAVYVGKGKIVDGINKGLILSPIDVDGCQAINTVIDIIHLLEKELEIVGDLK